MSNCAHCGGMNSGPRRARFCSTVCKQRAYRRRLWGAAEDVPAAEPCGNMPVLPYLPRPNRNAAATWPSRERVTAPADRRRR